MKSHTIPDPERELLLDSESSDQMLTLHKQDFYAKLREYFFTIIHSDMVFKESVWMISAGDVLTSEPREAERELLVASQIGEVVETYRNDPTRMLEEIYLCGKDTSIMGSVWDIPEEDRKIPSDELVGFCDDLY